jgi:hypothetical protein
MRPWQRPDKSEFLEVCEELLMRLNEDFPALLKAGEKEDFS